MMDHALGLTGMAGSILTEARRGKNIRNLVEGLFRQSVFGRLAGYEDANDDDAQQGTEAHLRLVYGKCGELAPRRFTAPKQDLALYVDIRDVPYYVSRILTLSSPRGLA